MHLVLAYRLNHRVITLTSEPSTQHIGVLKRTGEYRYFPWLGFLAKEEARHRGKPVKLEIYRIGTVGDVNVAWQDVPKGKHVQGCLTAEGAYAIVETSVRVI